jgi:hypothetical protein
VGQTGLEAELGCGAAGGKTAGRRSTGGTTGLCLMGCAEQGRKGKRFFLIFKNIQTNEFKPKFEFRHSKTMLQHVCNS